MLYFLSKFNVTNRSIGNYKHGLGVKKYNKPTVWTYFIYFNDILAGTIYRLTYDIDFQLARPYSDEFNNKYKSE
jgi:hypothetical protein